MRPTRILGIAPYEGMRNLMVSIAQNMPDVEMTAFVGDLEPGAAIASHYTSNTIDVILSRGGTAELIRQHTTLPVVEVELSVYDILRSLKLAESTSNQCAVVGFPSITKNATLLSEILQSNIAIHTIHHSDEAREVLRTLSMQGCSAVLCDMVTNSLAREYGLPALLITSGRESIEAAIRQAVHLSHTLFRLQSHAHLMESALESQCEHIQLYNAAGQLLYAHHGSPLPAPVQNAMEALRAHDVSTQAATTRILEHQQALWSLTAQPLLCDGQRHAVVTAQSTPTEIRLEHHGIRFYNKEETYDQFYHSFYGITQSSYLGTGLEEYAGSRHPLMIVGEPGTGKDQMVRLLYAKSPLSSSPLCVLDCALLGDNGWSYLLQDERSPLLMQNMTLHFRSVLSLNDKQFAQLCTVMQNVGTAERNRLIFTASVEANGMLHQRYQQLLNHFHCTTVTMTPLRARKGDIPYLAGLYISTLNLSDTRDIAGFAPDALALLQQYDWPANHDQFVRVLQQLAQMTHTSYIRLEDTENVLQQERKLFSSLSSAASLSQLIGQKTLEEIDQLVIQYVLEAEHGNQKATASRLGISRTTLWRTLQRMKGSG